MNKLFSSISTESSLPVEHHINRLALEAGVLSNAVDSLKNIIPSLSDKFSGMIASFKAEESPSDIMVKNAEADVRTLKPQFTYNSYASFDKTLVTIPEGFEGNFYTYSNMLLGASREVYANAEDILSNLQADLSAFITNRENKASNKDRTAFYKKVTARRLSIEKEMGSFFSEKHVRSKAYMTEVINRFEQIDELNHKNADILKIVDKRQMDKIGRMTEEVSKLLNIVLDDINSGEETTVSGAAARNISEGAYEAAKCVELCGMLQFRVHQLCGVTYDLTQQLKKILDKK